MGTDSQLPFGHCCLCLQPVNQCVVSPSGHAYCRECILEYILAKTKDIKRQQQLYEAEQARIREEQEAKRKSEQEEQVQRFAAAHEGVQALVQREEKLSSEYGGRVSSMGLVLLNIRLTEPHVMRRWHEINREEFRREQESKADFREREAKRAELKAVAFWIPDFTPEAKESTIPPVTCRLFSDPFRPLLISRCCSSRSSSPATEKTAEPNVWTAAAGEGPGRC